jgi:hypothetical protein
MTLHLVIPATAAPVTTAANTAASPNASYAEQVNSKFRRNGSHYMNIKERIDQRIASLPISVQSTVRNNLLGAVKSWEKKFPTKKSMADLDLCEAAYVPLSQILIDDTLQRPLDIAWCAHILVNWRDIQALPIMVYKPGQSSSTVSEQGGDYESLCLYNNTKEVWASWDGQHTAVVLYLIAVWGLGLDPDDVMIPVAKYRASSKSQMRLNFIGGNSSSGKNLMDEIDLFRQMIYGVRLDGIDIPDWEEAEEKQIALEQANLFVTHKKFNDYNQPGAISRMKEINAFSVSVIQDFATYSKYAQSYGPRPVATMEMDIMCNWFDMARKSNICYTESEIQDLATHLQVLFDGDFSDDGRFWEQARIAYANWWEKYYHDPEFRPAKMVFKMLWSTGGVFLFYQLKKTWNGRIPALKVDSPFQPSKVDLF